MEADAAADHLGMDKTRLYGLTNEGRIPAKKVGKKWIYDREELDAWMQSSRPLEDFFMDTPALIEGNSMFREPQREAYARVAEFFQDAGQLPVGCDLGLTAAHWELT